MKSLTRCGITILASLLARDAALAQTADLTLSIVVEKDQAGQPSIDRRGAFAVEFANRSAQPIRIWSEDCQLGYETLSFEWPGEDGQPARMYKRRPHPSNWKDKPPLPLVIAAGGTLRRKVLPDQIWGQRVWRGVPEPNTGQAIPLTAVFEIQPGQAAREQGVWTGRIASARVQTLVVDPNLQDPHAYLRADCPRQALKMLAADPKLAGRVDEYARTPLHLAAEYGQTSVVQWLLEHGANANAVAYNRFRPLYFAHDPAIVQLLLKHGADANADSIGGTALSEAADRISRFGNDEFFADEVAAARKVVKLLLDGGAEYDLTTACRLGELERVRALNAKAGREGVRAALGEAALEGRTDVVKLLLEGFDGLDRVDPNELPLTYWAKDRPDILKLLLAAGADPKLIINYRGNGRGPQGTSLLMETDSVDAARLLIERGADVNYKSPRGFTALHYACHAGDVAKVKLLLEHRADALARTVVGSTPQDCASCEVRPEHETSNARYVEVIRLLQRAGVAADLWSCIATGDVMNVASLLKADPKLASGKTFQGRPLLHEAVTLDRREIAKLLLDAGCDPNTRSQSEFIGSNGGTALLDAAFWGRPEIAELLIERGALVGAVDEKGVTPLHEAARLKQLPMARLLLKHGADVNAKTKKGETPLVWARLYGDPEEMSELLRKSGAGVRER